ncbi:VOC family protein [Streptomyces sp. NPDC005963]|uniref:VOC family protein n=1 Tax=Streptomyces sp. NPDC005963 TaxID=3156721 RepID=UPI0033EDB7D6
MTITLNHTIVVCHDKHQSARFLADILGLEISGVWGPFVSLVVPPVALDFIDITDYQAAKSDLIEPQHYAFLMNEEEFDGVFDRIKAAGIEYFADQFLEEAGQINHNYDGRGVYLRDPSGHIIECITQPYKGTPHGAEKGRWSGAIDQITEA